MTATVTVSRRRCRGPIAMFGEKAGPYCGKRR